MKYFLKIIILIFFITFSSTSILSQETILGSVRDTKNLPIIFASVSYSVKQIGAFTDSNGNFKIKKIVGDTLKLSSIGYKSVAIPIKDINDTLHITLKDEINILDQVIIKGKQKTNSSKYIGFYSTNDFFLYSTGPNNQYATYVPNELNLEGYIDEIKFRLSNYNNSKFNLCIRLLTKSETTGLPDEDLILFGNYLSRNDLKKVNKFSLKNKNITLPKNGVFVSFQWIPVNVNDTTSFATPYILSNNLANDNYIYTNYMGRGWYHSNKLKDALIHGYFCVPNISLKISY